MNRILTDNELKPFLQGSGFSANARALLAQQRIHFPLAAKFYGSLDGVQEKSFTIDGTVVRVQFNPARIQSSAAKVDAKSISERKCFLCEAHLPVEQKGLSFGNHYMVLVNPFPIFPEHFTVPHLIHTDQRISGRVGDFLALADLLSEFVIFYNGPKCGASAPDHFHFQAGNKGFIPLETEFESILNESEAVCKNGETDIYCIKPFGANCIAFVSDNIRSIEDAFEKAYNYLSEKSQEGAEPMMNLLGWKWQDKFVLTLFPRKLHRPSQFFAEGDSNILLSPAAVDLGGVFITPLEKDFTKITADDLSDILSQILISDDEIAKLCNSIAQ
ncbi:DUF4922 domain-containing protein [Parabacteroides sp. FAFU027]|uniref:DUF4922 domain-containing protein n=1 Tax=Parabacteroides sp. FAFU027 TaxID=2922715 RepID=UPI001FAE8ACB|nr:DUF4922 domain-containing protein [Parabacteroides sp. FAFU027]